MTPMLLNHEKKKNYPATAQGYDDWVRDNPQFMIEFKLWKMTTDLTHIELYGLRFNIQNLDFTDWMTWRLQSELNEVTEEITEDAQFEEIAIC